MTYLYIGLTVFVSVFAALQLHLFVQVLYERRMAKQHAPKCEICQSDADVLEVYRTPDGLRTLQMCEACSVENEEFRRTE